MQHHDFREDTPMGQRLMQLAQSGSISDFYITPWEPLCYKLNGELHRDDSFVYTPTHQLEVVPGCLDYAIVLGPHRFRVNQLVTRGKLRWVMRLLPVQIPAVDQVGVPPAAVKAFLEAKNGLFLVCGATGSGKSTTIASLVLHRAQRRCEHVVSFEDPIEYVYPENTPSLMSQREMGTDELNFGSSLRASLRQAPDVIIIGEIRDGETAEIALQASETGHVVVATLHTSTAAQTVARFLKLIPSERLESAQVTFADVMKMDPLSASHARRGERLALRGARAAASIRLGGQPHPPRGFQEARPGTGSGLEARNVQLRSQPGPESSGRVAMVHRQSGNGLQRA